MKLWPFHRKAATPEQKSLASPDAALEALFGLTPTASGLVLSAQAALRIPVVANAIQLISEAVASLDVTVKRIEDGAEIDVPDHPALGLLRGEANDWTTGFELIRQIVVDALMNDAGGMIWVNRINGERDGCARDPRLFHSGAGDVLGQPDLRRREGHNLPRL